METDFSDVYGPAAPYSEHKRGETIHYRLPGEAGNYTGVIIWCVEATEQAPMHYLVERNEPGGLGLDIVFPAYVVRS
jgi:hypothetical protein